MTFFHAEPQRIGSRSGKAMLALIAAGMVACGGDEVPESASTSQAAASGMDGDQGHSYVSGQPGGSWMVLDTREPLDRPLVVIADGELTAEGTFKHETRDATQPGSVRVRCEG